MVLPLCSSKHPLLPIEMLAQWMRSIGLSQTRDESSAGCIRIGQPHLSAFECKEARIVCSRGGIQRI